MGAVTGGRGYVGLLAFWMFTLAETRWWHLKQVDDGVPVLRDWSKQRGLSERTNNAENFVSDAQHEVQLDALLRHSQDGRGLSSTGTAKTLSDLSAVELCLAYQAVSALEPHPRRCPPCLHKWREHFWYLCHRCLGRVRGHS